MKLLVIRHGESEADILNVHEGRADFELTEHGKEQATAMAEYVSCHYQIDKIYCSTLKRASQTAAYLAEKTASPLLYEEQLMEFNNGLVAGLKHEEAEEKYPYIPDVPLHTAVYEQESMLLFRYRADFILSKIISENEADSTIAIVTHGGMINQLYRAFLSLPIQSNFVFCTGDTGIHEWVIEGCKRFIVMSNYLGHTQL